MPHLWCVPASRAMKSAGRIAPNLHVTVHSTFLRAHLDCAHNWRLAPMLWLRLRRATFICGQSITEIQIITEEAGRLGPLYNGRRIAPPEGDAMTWRNLRKVVRYLHAVAGPDSSVGPPDGQLLER